MNDIVLSICIPTYNRANCLEKTIKSIITQKAYHEYGDVEIIVMDNASEDNTELVCQEFIKLKTINFFYFRNPNKISASDNQEKALLYGKGLYRKLNNDTLLHEAGSLVILRNAVLDNLGAKKMMFFTNGRIFSKENILQGNSLNALVRIVSHQLTWIALYGFWKDSTSKLFDLSKKENYYLPQVDYACRTIGKNGDFIIYNNQIFVEQIILPKGGYHLVSVFLNDYLRILNNNLLLGNIAKSTCINEENKILLDFICPWIVRVKLFPEKYHFKIDGYNKIILTQFKDRPFIVLFFYFKYLLLFLVRFFHKKIFLWKASS